MSARPETVPLIKRIRAVAFDLDGTLVDTAPDLAAATNTMLRGMDLPAIGEDEVRAMIGDGVEVLVKRALGRSLGVEPGEPVCDAAMSRFRDAYTKTLFDRSRVYPGVRDTLKELRDAGLRLTCVTNKAAGFAAPLLVLAGLAEYFEHTLCASSPLERKPAPAMLLNVCSKLDILPGALLLVGDSPLDVRAARAAGCPVAAVLYGYAAEASLRALGPDWVIGNLAEIPNLEC